MKWTVAKPCTGNQVLVTCEETGRSAFASVRWNDRRIPHLYGDVWDERLDSDGVPVERVQVDASPEFV